VALADLLVQVNERIRPVRTQDFLSAGRITATIEQHLGVLGALLAGDERLAARLLTHHIAESMDVVEQRVATAFARMSTRSDPRRPRATGGGGGTARPRPPASRRRR
jgi:DNA-binding GntR family transcriptional regulator